KAPSEDAQLDERLRGRWARSLTQGEVELWSRHRHFPLRARRPRWLGKLVRDRVSHATVGDEKPSRAGAPPGAGGWSRAAPACARGPSHAIGGDTRRPASLRCASWVAVHARHRWIET